MHRMRRVTSEKEQQGFVAIVVAAMLIVLMALITIGFTRIIQRDQRQVLDRQLSQQALYAAESGINDVYTMLQSGTAPAEKTDCDVSGMPNAGQIDVEAGVSYTCALYDRSPNELTYSVPINESKLVRLTSSGAAFDTFRISWGIEDGANSNNVGSLPDCADAGEFVSSRTPMSPLLRVDLTSLANLNRDSLISATDSMYLAPCQSSSGSATHTFANSKGVVIPVPCYDSAGSQPCTVTIEDAGGTDFLARVRAVYAPAQVTISGADSSGVTLSMIGGQTVIDVTGKAQDVTRRLRVTVPEADVSDVPDGVVQIYNGFCKLLAVGDSDVTDDCTP